MINKNKNLTKKVLSELQVWDITDQTLLLISEHILNILIYFNDISYGLFT